MSVRIVRCLRGPNVWAACPVLEIAVDGGSADVLRQALDLPAEADPALTVARAVAHLQTQAGTAVSFAAANGRAAAVEFAEEPVGRAAVESAARLLAGTTTLADELPGLRDVAYQQRLPASTAVVYHAARARGIPAVRLSPEYGRYLRLGHGAKQHWTLASEPDSVSAVARTAATDKYLAKELLRAVGVPVPDGRLVRSADDAWAAAQTLGLPVAIKPQDSDLATGVSLDLRSREQVEAAFHAAHEHSTWVLVERFAPGTEPRGRSTASWSSPTGSPR